MSLVSVIIPVYNAKPYLTMCIESIIRQQFNDWELLLIDNGSTDGSRELCEKYAASLNNVQVLCQTEGGVSASRNAGINAASGKYILFADADDYLSGREVLSDMVYAIESSSADIVVGNYHRLWKGKLLPAKKHNIFNKNERESAAFRFQGFFSTGTLSYVWCKMYRRSFLEKNSIYFGEFTYAEDKLFNFSCYIHGAKYSFINRNVYVYRKNDTSISHAYRKDSVQSWMRIAKNLHQLLKLENLTEKYGDLVANTIFFAAFFDSKMEYIHASHSIAAVINTLRSYRQYPLSKKYFAEFASFRMIRNIPSPLWKIMIWGFSFAMYFKWYFPLALGIKLLVDCRIDERLSDTGLREKE